MPTLEPGDMIKRFLPYIGPLIGITGVSLALYFHAQSVRERTPLYSVGARSTIVDSSIATPSPLQVLYKGHPVGNTNVVATVVYFWNGGKQPITSEDVLEPVSIDLESSEILEARILHVSRPVTKLEIHPIPDSSKNVLPISFGILEHSDGGSIQIIYAGESDASITVRGTIVGAGAPLLFSGGRRERSPEEAVRSLNKLSRVMEVGSYGMTLVVSLYLAFGLRIRKKLGYHPSAPSKAAIVILVVALVMYLGIDVDAYFERHRPEIPSSLIGP